MRFREGRFAPKAGGDGNGEPFGQPFQLRPGLRVMHALAGIDHRALGVDEQVGRLLHMNGVRAVAGAQHRRVVQRLRYIFVPHVGGDLDDDRPAAAVFQLGEGAAKNVGDFRGEDDRFRRFRKRLHRLAGIEVRLDMRKPALIAHRQHQHGNGFAVALRDAAHRILRTGAMLHAERADRASRCHPRDRIRHVDADALLPHHHRPDIGLRRMLDQMVDRIAAEDLDPSRFMISAIAVPSFMASLSLGQAGWSG
ncbi:hypothetical protein ACVWZW_003023 [Bradyrhizobium sp. F1.13.4]